MGGAMCSRCVSENQVLSLGMYLTLSTTACVSAKWQISLRSGGAAESLSTHQPSLLTLHRTKSSSIRYANGGANIAWCLSTIVCQSAHARCIWTRGTALTSMQRRISLKKRSGKVPLCHLPKSVRLRFVTPSLLTTERYTMMQLAARTMRRPLLQ